MKMFLLLPFGLWLGALLMRSYKEKTFWRISEGIICGAIIFALYAPFNSGLEMDTAGNASDESSMLIALSALGILVAAVYALLLPFERQSFFLKRAS